MNVVSKGSHERFGPITMPCKNIVTNCCVDSANNVNRACLVLFLSFLHNDVSMVVIEVVFDYLRSRPRLNPILVKFNFINRRD